MGAKVKEEVSSGIDLRPGCGFCFESVAANDGREAYRSAVACSQCGRIFHRVCWEKNTRCDYCNGKTSQTFQPANLTPALVIARNRPVPILPSGIYRLNSGRQAIVWNAGIQAGQLARAALAGLILVALAIAAGLFTYPVWELQQFSAMTIMDAILKQPPPAESILPDIICGIVFGWICFVSWLPEENKQVEGRVAGFTRLLGGLAILLGVDLFLFKFNPMDFASLVDHASGNPSILYAQGVTLLLVLIFTGVYRLLAHMNRPINLRMRIPERLANVLGWIRLAVVALLLAGATALLVTAHLPPVASLPVLQMFDLGGMDVIVSRLFLACFFAALATAGLIFWSPGFRKLGGRTGFLRLLIIIACLGTVVLLYRSTDDTSALAACIPAAVGLMVLATPLQRSLS
jgi:hypothetical protein